MLDNDDSKQMQCSSEIFVG